MSLSDLYTAQSDLTDEDMKYLKDNAFLMSLERSPEEQIEHYIDCIQSSHEEKLALHELVITHLPRFHEEWINEEINLGSEEDYDNYEWYLHLLDESEMNLDMNAHECEEAAHELFANNPWETRDFEASATKVSKRSGFYAWSEITHVGENYATGDTDYGKVYIPIHFVHQLSLQVGQMILMSMTFKGFGGCRSANMPWRCSFIQLSS